MQPKRALIIGGTGLIGCYLAADLLTAGYKVTILSRSTRLVAPEAFADEEQIKKIDLVHGEMTDVKLLVELINDADIVFHKTLSQGMSGAVENAQQFLENKVGAAAAVVEALRKAPQKPELLVLGSSISVYGEGGYECARCGTVRPDLRYVHARSASSWNPVCPKCGAANILPVLIDEDAERRGLSVYAVAKKAEEDLFAGACQMNAISMVGLRYSTVIGAGQSWHNPFTHFLDLLMDKKAPVLHEDGLQTRDYIFVKDVVAANLRAVKKHHPGTRFYNVVSGHSASLISVAQQLAEKYAQQVGSQSVIEPEIDHTLVPGDVRHCFASADRIERELGFEATIELSAGLDELVGWYARKKHIRV